MEGANLSGTELARQYVCDQQQYWRASLMQCPRRATRMAALNLRLRKTARVSPWGCTLVTLLIFQPCETVPCFIRDIPNIEDNCKSKRLPTRFDQIERLQTTNPIDGICLQATKLLPATFFLFQTCYLLFLICVYFHLLIEFLKKQFWFVKLVNQTNLMVQIMKLITKWKENENVRIIEQWNIS